MLVARTRIGSRRYPMSIEQWRSDAVRYPISVAQVDIDIQRANRGIDKAIRMSRRATHPTYPLYLDDEIRTMNVRALRIVNHGIPH
jgi:hypothetical protein